MSMSTVFYIQKSVSPTFNQARKKITSCRMPNKIPTGDILTDSTKKEWIIINSIARGGFGEIYSAASKTSPKQHNYVVKIEPSENGPLFCEKTVYIRIGKKEDIKEYMQVKGLSSLGLPQFYGSGIHSVNGKKFRFLVMDRYGKDLWTIFLENKRRFPASTVFKIANQVLEVLEYIHSKGYVHADIKGANLLLGRNKGCENQVYLVDFGLAAKYATHYKADPRRAHNGTIEYTSRDGHEGIVTRRGDIEVLGYNLLHWLSSNLPWENLKGVHEVQTKKIKYMKDYTLLIQTSFKNKESPKALDKYFAYFTNMEPLGEPNYEKLKFYMEQGIKATGDTGSKLEFSIVKVNNQKSPIPAKRRKTDNTDLKSIIPLDSRTRTFKTIQLSESNSSGSEDFVDCTPEKQQKKKSWKNSPAVVSCAEVPLKSAEPVTRRSKRVIKK